MSKATGDKELVSCCWGWAEPEPAVASAEGRSGPGSKERSSGQAGQALDVRQQGMELGAGWAGPRRPALCPLAAAQRRGCLFSLGDL